MRHRLLGSTILAALGLAFARDAHAQTASGFSLNRYEPSERGSEWFSQDTLDLRGHLRPAIGVTGDFGYKPLVIYNSDGSERSAIVETQLFAHVGASIVLLDRIRFGLNLPIALSQSGAGGTASGVTYTPAEKTSLGDVRVGGDVRILGRYGEAFTLAGGVQVFIPSGDRAQYTSDGKVRVTPRLQAAGDIDMFAYALRLGLAYRGLNESFAGSSLGTEFTFGASAGVRVLDKKLLLGPEIFGSTVVVDGESFNKQATPFELIFGGHYSFGDYRLGAGVGPGLSRGFGTPQVRALLSFEWAPAFEEPKGPGDRDGDGILDNADACPDEKGIKSDDPKTNGCPEKKVDADDDKDGIPNAQDACPTVAGVKTSDPKTNGCPSDKDGDGIYDTDDACVDVKGVKTEDPKTNGCPPDKDGDGIYDADDACPDVKGVKDADPKKNGCPPDTDGDAILDSEDACPNTPGPKNADPKKNGCPAVAIEAGQIKILQQVKFKTDSAVILKESDEILTAVAKIMADHPEIKVIRVEGHTDNKGSKAHNKDLSAKRAASVVTWLTTKGKVDKKRLKSAGFGDERPIDTNDTDAGRQNNRRVEFHIEGNESGKVEEKK